MRVPQNVCTLLLMLFSCVGAVTAQSSLWPPSSANFYKSQLRPARLDRARVAALRSLLLNRREQDGWCDADDTTWVKNLQFSEVPLGPHSVTLVEPGVGCARGAQGSNSAMWLVDWIGTRPHLIATPATGFNGFFGSVRPLSSHGFRDVIVGEHVSADRIGLGYFRFDGTTYREISSAVAIGDDEGNERITEIKPVTPQP